MSLTVEQILNECREEFPQTFELEKEASESTVKIESDEVGKMVNLLKVASIPEATRVEQLPQIESNIYEKVAEAVILNGVLKTIDEEGVKLAEFREQALYKGYSPEEVEDFIEKQARVSALKNIFNAKSGKTALKGLVGAGILGGAGVGGYQAGKEKQKKTTKVVGQTAFSAGRKYQYSRMRAMAERRQLLEDYLQQRLSQQKQGKS